MPIGKHGHIFPVIHHCTATEGCLLENGHRGGCSKVRLIQYRGSGSDLATDVLDALHESEVDRFLAYFERLRKAYKENPTLTAPIGDFTKRN